MKKIINKPETVVMEMCNGIAIAHPELEFIRKYKIMKKKNINQEKVSLISGGGSGHEPAHAGFIGRGMLDAAVCGDVFASPSQIQVYQAIRATASKKGTLLIIKNYSGDMMNFKNAAYLASEDGIKVDYVKVDDDIAVKDSLYTVGRRGVAGTVLVHKIAGAAAESGLSLEEVKKVAEKAVSNVRSLGFAFSSCTVPAKGTPTFQIAEDEMEFGVGIHGEPGIKREKIAIADELSERIVDSILEDIKIDDKNTEEVAVLINGFGGTPLQELYLFNNSVTAELVKKNIKISRIFVGNYMTSIDMQGASVSIMKLDEELKTLLSKESDTPAFKVSGPAGVGEYVSLEENKDIEKEVSFGIETDEKFSRINNEKINLNNIIYIVDKMSEVIIKNEIPFCELDSHAGDGDFGMSVAKGFKQLKREWKQILLEQYKNIGAFLNACSLVIMEHCGGASGPIWGSAFRAAGRQVGAKTELTISEFAEMMQAAVKGVQATGERSFGRGAVVGDKTLVDALVPCADAWTDCAKLNADFKEAFKLSAEAAVEGAKNTEKIVARMGRAGTVGDRSIGYPDAGAYGLGVIFTEISEVIK
ncbi:PTS-dependent dihydroxyacetone kinase, dihydroxyacetone-binding subunit DhaK [Clostridium pasteurianum DSM 525 = ATCC 6013]|uniref:phosphoenolpyruvate--glycerone phosphotransferase n=1 Tax=Clostridium pasteurianum DSM 525 = ATCC 6013 TaxID=1262449 RepID=A0A0H3J0E7_CLOPA|nr:dihydroxyacetone kinase subunit DhaK [Clostridium pasteurianum]AJA47316.1 PTS-dependent dihydroxyacetone kinase, dihydroxyacetone-binding subunit DhaK [Clostridium pasteurianum DSM 525 = ATCC 6013]AJA51304.1 PTS-dependent dihydroxyacetone kinase, dihydroxyacetone-binding subunit DhaK [Clostridium pasteurianum DSM 525 = ATCC 6013]ELP58653.1 dihydroxyacetone kinase [Clostridium pasteurianum DSM 525 = ATCC 6013]KRU12688.1 dihydroxyacetone kinase, DhaK subunit [Clostridium pasteurianum DSM 525 =